MASYIAIFLTVLSIPIISLKEGGQQATPDSQKNDWWGSLMPLWSSKDSIIGNINSLSLLNALAFTIGMILTFGVSQEPRNFRANFLIFSMVFVGLIFAIQEIRDSSLLSFLILSLGLLSKSKVAKSVTARRFLFFGALICMIIGATFKIPTALGCILIMLLWSNETQGRNGTKAKSVAQALAVFFVALMVAISAYTLDYLIGKTAELQKSYPEQQVMLLDLAAFICWSHNTQIRQEGLFVAVSSQKTQVYEKDICASLRPNSWVYLVQESGGGSKSFGPPLEILKSESQVSELRQGWFRLLIKYPGQYAQNKAAIGSQLLWVGNPFGGIANELVDLRTKFSDRIWSQIGWLLLLLGNIKFFSLPFQVTLLLLLRRTFMCEFMDKTKLAFMTIAYFCNLVLLCVSYVSDEARYIFPFVFIVYIIAIRSSLLFCRRNTCPKVN